MIYDQKHREHKKYFKFGASMQLILTKATTIIEKTGTIDENPWINVIEFD